MITPPHRLNAYFFQDQTKLQADKEHYHEVVRRNYKILAKMMVSTEDEFKTPPIPVFEFKFDDILSRMSNYQSQFDNYMSQSRKLLDDKRHQFQKEYDDNEQKIDMLKSEIESYNNLALQNAQAKALALDELEESKNAIINYTVKRDEMTETFNAMKAEIENLEKEIQEKKAQINREKEGLEAQISNDEPELRFWEQTLGLRIEGANREDHIKFIFKYIDPSDESKEYNVILDLRESVYKLAECNPVIPQQEIDDALKTLNNSQNLTLFLKSIRNSFKSI